MRHITTHLKDGTKLIHFVLVRFSPEGAGATNQTTDHQANATVILALTNQLKALHLQMHALQHSDETAVQVTTRTKRCEKRTGLQQLDDTVKRDSERYEGSCGEYLVELVLLHLLVTKPQTTLCEVDARGEGVVCKSRI